MDGSDHEYILGAAHALALGPSGYLTGASSEPITQPMTPPIDPPANCNPEPDILSFRQVATLSTVIQPDFTNGAITPADAALAQVLPGKVSSSILGISVFSSAVLAVVKKRLEVQKEGATTQLTLGHVITKMLVPAKYKVCTNAQVKRNSLGNVVCKNHGVIKIAHAFKVKPASFAEEGDSGALVTTVGPCPQPVGMVVGRNSAGTAVIVASLPDVLAALQRAGGYSSLSVVGGGGGCTSSTSEIELPDGTG